MPLITSQSVVRDLFRRGRSLCSGTHTADIKVSVTLETLGKNLLSLSLKCQKSPVCYNYRTAVPAFSLASAGSCFPFLVATSLPTLPFHLQASNGALDASCVLNIPDFSLCHKMENTLCSYTGAHLLFCLTNTVTPSWGLYCHRFNPYKKLKSLHHIPQHSVALRGCLHHKRHMTKWSHCICGTRARTGKDCSAPDNTGKR